jgi:hypothetical protein
MAFITPNIAQFWGFTGGALHLGPFAITAMFGTTSACGHKARHLAHRTHLQVALAAPDRSRRSFYTICLCRMTLFACPALVNHI